MRNLVQYPITEREILQCLAGLATEFEQGMLLGDMRPVILRTTAVLIEALGRMQRDQNAPIKLPIDAASEHTWLAQNVDWRASTL